MSVSINKIKSDIQNFYDTYSRFPKTNEIMDNFGYSHNMIMNIFKQNNEVYQDYLASIDCFALNKPNKKYYGTYLQKFVDVVEENKDGLSGNLYEFSKKCCKKYKLPNIRWFINNCPDKYVCDIETFKDYAGIKQRIMTREQCIKKIICMSNDLNRPLKYDDFRGEVYGQVSISAIKQYWGNFE